MYRTAIAKGVQTAIPSALRAIDVVDITQARLEGRQGERWAGTSIRCLPTIPTTVLVFPPALQFAVCLMQVITALPQHGG